MIGVGVVGLGIGNQHALSILKNHDCNLSHLSDFDVKKVEQFKKKHNRKDIKNSTFEDLLCEETIDIISIASYDDYHYAQVLEGLKANKHIFVEKPLCQTWEQLVSLYHILKKTNCFLMSNLVLRTSELFGYVHNMILEGRLGEIFYFEGDYLYGRLHKITEGWRKNVNNYSVMEGGGIHMIDLMLNLTGQRPSHVFSTGNKIATQNTDFKYYDFHSAIFHFKSNLVGKITANFGCIHPHQHVIKIYGTKGTFIYDDQGARFFNKCSDNTKPEILYQKAKPEEKGLLLNKLVEQIKKGEPSIESQKEFDLMSNVIAAQEALNTGQLTEVKYLKC